MSQTKYCCLLKVKRFFPQNVWAGYDTAPDDAIQMDVNKILYPFYTTKKVSHVTATITKKCASLATILRYTTKIHTIGYLQDRFSKQGTSF